MKNCEFCEDSSVAFIKNKIISNLEKENINADNFIKSDPKSRLNIIIEKFDLKKNGFFKKDKLKKF